MSNPLTQHYDSDIEVIELHGCKFHIKLPTIANKRFQRSVMSRVAKRNEAGDFEAGDITIEEMITEMTANDLKEAKKHRLLKKEGYNPALSNE